MKKFKRISGMSLSLAALVMASGCAQEDLDHFYGRDVEPGTYQQNYQGGATDSFYEQQNASREANMRAVREQNYKNQMQDYKNGYSNTLPNY